MEDDGIEDRAYHHRRSQVFVAGRRGGGRLQRHRRTGARADQCDARRSRWSATYNAFLHLTDPSIPKNSGCFRPIKVVAPPGTHGQCRLPGAVGRRQHRDAPAHRRRGDRRAGPRRARPRAMAAEGGTHINFVFGGTRYRDRRILRLLRHRAGRLGRPRRAPTATTRSDSSTATAAPCRSKSSRRAIPWLVEELGTGARFRRRRPVPRRARHAQAVATAAARRSRSAR